MKKMMLATLVFCFLFSFSAIAGGNNRSGFRIVVETTAAPETEPETTVPETEPETTVPETEPETTVPETTAAPETEPETTVPETTAAPETTYYEDEIVVYFAPEVETEVELIPEIIPEVAFIPNVGDDSNRTIAVTATAVAIISFSIFLYLAVNKKANTKEIYFEEL